MGERRTPPDGSPEDAAPNLFDALRELSDVARAAARDGGDVLSALRSLLAADIALARSAAISIAMFGAGALLLLASSWLLLLGVIVSALVLAGLSWLAAFAIATGIALAGTALLGWLAWRAVGDVTLAATRRQVARLGTAESTPPDAPAAEDAPQAEEHAT